MEKIVKFVNKYGLIIILLLSLVVFFKSCSTSQKLSEFKSINYSQTVRLDSLIRTSHINMPTKNDMMLLNNELMREYNSLIFDILNNKLTSDELTKRLKLIENNLVKIQTDNKNPNTK
jgi:hypothetical protein